MQNKSLISLLVASVLATTALTYLGSIFVIVPAVLSLALAAVIYRRARWLQDFRLDRYKRRRQSIEPMTPSKQQTIKPRKETRVERHPNTHRNGKP